MGTQDDINWIKDKLDTIERSLIGDLETDKPGVMERLKKLEDHSNCVKKFSWFTISTVVGIIIVAILKLIMH